MYTLQLLQVHLASNRLATPFAFPTALILCGILEIIYWEHSSELLVRTYMVASHRYVICLLHMYD